MNEENEKKKNVMIQEGECKMKSKERREENRFMRIRER